MELPTAAPPYVPAAALKDRVRTYQHDAVAELFDHSFDDAYEYAHALTGDDATAERALSAAYARALERLSEYDGDSSGLPAWILGLVEESVQRTPHTQADGIRGRLGRLGHHEHQALTLRLVAAREPSVIATATGRRVTSVLASQTSALRGLAGLTGLSLGLPAAHRQLDAALDRLLQGDSADEAAGYAPAVTDARKLLDVAAEVVELPRLGAGSAVRGRIRSEFLAGAGERRAQWVHTHHAPAVVPGRRPRARPSHISTAAALMLACGLALVAGVVLAAAAALASPSSAVYPLKRMGEGVLLGLTFDRIAKANLEVKLAEERLKEAETEAAAGHGEGAVTAVNTRHDELLAAGQDLRLISHRSKSWTAARDRFESEANKPLDTLERSVVANGDKAAASDIQSSFEHFQAERQLIDKQLGVPARAGGPGQAPAGAPGSVPTPSPGG